MAKHRIGRINDEMQKEIAMILREVKDPRLSSAFISVTAVDATPDLKFAKVYYSSLSKEKKEIAMGLRSSAGFIRRQLAQRMNLRMTPELSFVPDHSIKHGAHIAQLLEGSEFSDDVTEEKND